MANEDKTPTAAAEEAAADGLPDSIKALKAQLKAANKRADDADAYAKELEAEQDADGADGPTKLLKVLVKAVTALVEAQAKTVEKPKTHAETYPDGKVPVPEKYKGTRTYRLTAPHYRRGVRYEIGERISVTNEIPSKTWVEIKPNEKAPEPVTIDLSAPAKRASDVEV